MHNMHFHNFLVNFQLLVSIHMFLKASYSFVVDLTVWGYHEYRSIPENSLSSYLSVNISECEVGNPRDTHDVAIKKSIAGECCTVGHIHRKISFLYSIFIRSGGVIYCTVSGHRCHSMF